MRFNCSRLASLPRCASPGVADLGFPQVEPLEPYKPPDVGQPGVADPGCPAGPAFGVRRVRGDRPGRRRRFGSAGASSVWSWVSPWRFASPASVMAVWERRRWRSCPSPRRCSSPASSTPVYWSCSVWSRVMSSRCVSPGPLTSVHSSRRVCSRVSPRRCSIPGSDDLGPAERQLLQPGQVGQAGQIVVCHLGPGERDRLDGQPVPRSPPSDRHGIAADGCRPARGFWPRRRTAGGSGPAARQTKPRPARRPPPGRAPTPSAGGGEPREGSVATKRRPVVRDS